MENKENYSGGENFDLHNILLKGRNLNLKEKTDFFSNFTNNLMENQEMFCMRCITTPAGREVEIADAYTGETKKMLMFGSNNYLGLANHPYVKTKVHEAINNFGVGIGGPPLLNGYSSLHRELEVRLAALKGAEDAMIFSSGYGANVGLVSGLMNSESIVIYDSYSHASFCDGIKMSGAQSYVFSHNNLDMLERRIKNIRMINNKDIFVGVEGVYSMDGDLAPLDKIVGLCKKYNACLIVDDAHGTGVMGQYGRGSAEHFNVHGKVDITMGTFSKSFSVTGGFVTGPGSIINYLRFFARSYMFSASLAPVVVATVLAGLDVLENEPELLESLRINMSYAAARLNASGFEAYDNSPIFPLIAPEWMDIRKAGYEFHKRGIFVNSIEYPAVPLSQQRFRISIMATHTKEDIDRMIDAVNEVFYENRYFIKKEEFEYAVA
jgi:glycine C-acetyltransferase